MINFERSMTLVQAAAHHYGMKELAEHLNKAPSTLYAELNQTDGYKIGAKDFFKTINKTGDFSALKALLGDMGWALYPLPSPEQKLPPTQSSLICLLAIANKECSESFGVTLSVLEDGEVTKNEAVKGSNECSEAIDSLVQLKAQFDAIKRG